MPAPAAASSPLHHEPRARVIIRQVGLVTPLGHSAWETFAALLAGRRLHDRAHALPEDVDPVTLVRALGGVSFARGGSTDPVVEIAERAAREAMDGGDSSSGLIARETAIGAGADLVIRLAASKGAVMALDDAVRQLRPRRTGRRGLAPPPIPDALDALALGPHGYLASRLAQRLGRPVGGCVVAACASSLTALDAARRDLLAGPANLPDGQPPRRALVVTAEASLAPQFVFSYQRLGVLPPLTPAGYDGRPLHRERSGFMLAELAAAVLLERREADQPVHPGEIKLLDTAVAGEGHDLIRPAPGMPGLCHVAEALCAGRPPIDLLHPHATGTPGHDEDELACLAGCLPSGHAPGDVYAVKGAVGHGLGAAGLVSLVIAWLCARTGRRPPMGWLDQPIAAPWPVRAEGEPGRPLRHQAVFAAGFGGHVAGARIERQA